MKRKNDYKGLMKLIVLAFGLGIASFVIVFLFVVFVYGKKGNEKKVDDKNKTTETIINKADITKKLVLIRKIDLADEKMVVTDLDNPEDEDLELIVAGYTKIEDEYGNKMLEQELEIGKVVDVRYDKDSKKTETIKISGYTWKRKDIKDLKINQNEKTILAENKKYNYTNKTIKTYKGEQILFSDITADAVVDIEGYKENVWSIEVKKYDGYLEFVNHEKFIGANLEIDTDIFKNIEVENKITLSPGEHKVVIKRADIEPLIKTIVIKEKETTTIDLSDVELKRGNVKFNVNTDDYNINISNEDKSVDLDFSGEDVELQYGNYKAEITKEGYEPITKEIKVFSPNITVNVSLKKINEFSQVKVTSNVKGAELYINDDLVGKLPLTTRVKLGEHKFSVRSSGYIPVVKTVKIEDENESINFDLEIDDPYSIDSPDANTPGEDVYKR